MKRFSLIMMIILGIGACNVDPAERNNAGNAFAKQGLYEQAIGAYQAAQVGAPDEPEAYYNAASAYAAQGDFDKAIHALEQAEKTDDVELRVRVLYNLGTVYFQMERFDEAAAAYRQALKIDPSDDDARHNLELALLRLADSSPTPTPATGDDNALTQTPESEQPVVASPIGEATALPEISTAAAESSEILSTLSVEDAERILDGVQQGQLSPPEPQSQSTPSNGNSYKDW